MRIRFLACIVLPAILALAGCQSTSSNYGMVTSETTVARLSICHTFDCRLRATLRLTGADARRFASIMDAGKGSAQAERRAAASAIAYFETRAGQTIGVRDAAKSDITQSGEIGQMDCIDESTNTHTLLSYLESRGLIRHHKVEANVSRGLFVDGRYPHSTAVLSERSGGRRWAVDSWYEPMGGKPDIMPLDQWKTRGVMGER
jgi:hypothetical protein